MWFCRNDIYPADYNLRKLSEIMLLEYKVSDDVNVKI